MCMPKRFLKFPENFLWGSATASHQIEGDCKNNDWSHEVFNRYKDQLPWMRQALEKIPDVGTSCDSFNRYKEDFDLIEKMNNNSHRLSIEWARIEPKEDEFDDQAIKHYRNVLEDLKRRNIKVMLSLHHFTSPAWFILKKGWEKSSNNKYFLRYVKYVVENLGDLVDFWLTINEPDAYVFCGYFHGWWPPMQKNKLKGLIVFRNLAKAHKRAYVLIHQICNDKFNNKPEVGFANSLQAYSSYIKHRLSNQLKQYFYYKVSNHGFYLLSGKRYHDFLGVNYYFQVRLNRKYSKLFSIQEDPSVEGRRMTDMNWLVHPHGIYEVLVDLSTYKKPIYVTENGIATEDDSFRKQFIHEHLEEIYYAIKAGVDVRGYFYWSLLDNYEWAEGYRPKFGLVAVDFDTKQRQMKESGEYYANIAKKNGLEL